MSQHDLADPEAIGLDPAALDALVERARREIDEGVLPSCQLAVAREGRLGLFTTLGDAAPDSRYVIYSCTKGLVAGAMFQLLADGSVKLDQRVADLVPEFGTNGKDVVTVEMVMLHTGGFPMAPMNLHKAGDRAFRLQKFSEWRLTWEPGTRFEYHPTSGHWVLGEIIERVTGIDAPTYVNTKVLDPLGLTALRLGVPVEEQGDVNVVEERGELPTPEEIEAVLGVPLDLRELMGGLTSQLLLELNEPDIRAIGVPGGGAVSTAADLALYYQGFLHDPAGIWPEERIAWATEVRNEFPDPIRGMSANRSLGLQVAGSGRDAQLRGFGHGQSPRTFGHDGAAGQIAWVDPDSGVSFVYLTNGMDQHLIREGRRKVGLSSRAAACAAEQG